MAAGWFTGVLAGFFSWIDQSKDLAHRFVQNITGHPPDAFRLPHPPVQALCLVRQYRPFYTEIPRKKHFEWIALHLGGYWTAQRQTDPAVVRARRDNQRWTMTSLLVARLRIEL